MNLPEYNILLFGETGAGKSTTINALANYLQYDSIEVATSGDFVQTIPSRLKIFDRVSCEYLVFEDGGDDDVNENHNEMGNSVTQSPKSYLFEFEDKRIRVIDTPGMGDTGGIEVDKENVRKILDHLKTLETIHAVCFLIKTTTTRKTASFRYCLDELLGLLDRGSAQTNLVFCFTFCRNSLYGPGDGYATLKDVLQDNHNSEGQVKINLESGRNCYYIDNEAYHYLVARKHDYPFSENKEASYKESWDNSSNSVKKMITQITNLPPVLLRNTFTLINARKWLPTFREPMQALQDRLNVRVDPILKLESLNDENVQKSDICNNFRSDANEIRDELDLMIKFVCKLAYFLIEHSNTTCEALIEPYLQYLNPEMVKQTNSEYLAILVNEFIISTRNKICSQDIDSNSYIQAIFELEHKLEKIDNFESWFSDLESFNSEIYSELNNRRLLCPLNDQPNQPKNANHNESKNNIHEINKNKDKIIEQNILRPSRPAPKPPIISEKLANDLNALSIDEISDQMNPQNQQTKLNNTIQELAPSLPPGIQIVPIKIKVLPKIVVKQDTTKINPTKKIGKWTSGKKKHAPPVPLVRSSKRPQVAPPPVPSQNGHNIDKS